MNIAQHAQLSIYDKSFSATVKFRLLGRFFCPMRWLIPWTVVPFCWYTAVGKLSAQYQNVWRYLWTSIKCQRTWLMSRLQTSVFLLLFAEKMAFFLLTGYRSAWYQNNAHSLHCSIVDGNWRVKSHKEQVWNSSSRVCNCQLPSGIPEI